MTSDIQVSNYCDMCGKPLIDGQVCPCSVVENKRKEKRTGCRTIIVVIVILLFAVGFSVFNYNRDNGIQEKRDAFLSAVRQFEQKVTAQDNKLKKYEEEAIDTAVLEPISTLQQEVIGISNLLLSLNTNTYSGASTYNNTIYEYQAKMQSLNNVVATANKHYDEIEAISSVKPPTGEPTDKKLFEIIGLSEPPSLAADKDITAINNAIESRYKEQKERRNNWNNKAASINAVQDEVNSLRAQIYGRYGTTGSGISVPSASKLNS